MKAEVAFMLLVSISSAFNWQSFCAAPVSEKFLLQNERLKQILTGSVINPDVDHTWAVGSAEYSNRWANEFKSSSPSGYAAAMLNVEEYLKNISETTPVKMVRVGDYNVNICIASPDKCEHVNKTSVQQPLKNTSTKICGSFEYNWAQYCSNMANSIDRLDCEGVDQQQKRDIVQRMWDAQGCKQQG